MESYYAPSVSYWDGRGTRVRDNGLLKPSSALNQSNPVLFIHGYNNDQRDASAAYTRFMGLLGSPAGPNARVVGVYWPGHNWEGALFYMQAIGKAKEVAPKLAQDLYTQARNRGYLKVDIVAHSLGCRLTLETVREILALRRRDGERHILPACLVVGKVVFMAGGGPHRVSG
ncbi:alpha/beta hydrolase [Rufibacter sp. LB8]|uniref:alpha/beta hydrolase n=1 Tax=Rufibacter sp. LB8 TaxID=2777781 RepID=UPI00178C3ADF|nr:alpha/beta hydrolase [Rufibacter sp. LB8]